MRISTLLWLVCLLSLQNVLGQITKIKDYSNRESQEIGTFKGVTFKEAGFSGLFYIPGTNGKEFWTNSDRGVNMDCGNANLPACRPTYDKMYAFPNYTPKMHHIILEGDSIRIIRTVTIKRPNGTGATGLLNPTGLGSTAIELPSFDTVQDCMNFLSKTAAKDTFGIDAEGIQIDRQGNFWLCEEGGACIWKLNKEGVLIKRYTPYANLPGAQAVDILLDTVYKYRKNNRGFEGITITPNGKVYGIIQSPILYPNQSTGENTRIHRIIEIDPQTNQQRMLAYLNDGIIGSSGANQIRLRDWKIGDMAAINDSLILVIEAAARGNTDIKRVYQINIKNATAVTSGLYSGQTLEALKDSAGLAAEGIVPVQKKLVMDLLANGWPSSYDKAEGLTIINDSTIAVCNDNDFNASAPGGDGLPVAGNLLSHVVTFRLSGTDKLSGLQLPLVPEFNLDFNGAKMIERDSSFNPSKGNSFGRRRIQETHVKKLFVVNPGTDTLIVYNMTWKNTTLNPFKYGTLNFPLKVAAKDSISFDLQFTPTVTDTVRNMLHIISNDRGEDTFFLVVSGAGVTPEISVKGNGVDLVSGQTMVSVNNSTDFGLYNTDNPNIKTFKISNDNADTLFIKDIKTSNNDFKIEGINVWPFYLTAGMAQTFNIRWTKTSTSNESTIQIINNDLDESTFSFKVSGTVLSAINHSATSSVHAYFNEANESVYIKGIQWENEYGQINVYDITGKQMLQNTLQQNELKETIQIPTESLYEGYYIIKVMDGNQVCFTTKVTIKNNH